ncbi:MAG: hypothetical protein J0I31_19205 [Rhizobiales bacterium]|nr:hypothetical protein [Hyphomicrobiales bacterium]
MSAQVPVLAMPALDPARHRIEMTIPHGATIAAIVEEVWRRHLPGATREQLGRAVRVSIDGHLIDPRYWHLVRPRPGRLVVVRVTPGDALKSILGILVTIAAAFVAPMVAGALLPLLGISGATANMIATAGLALMGNMLLNAFIPGQQPKDETKQSPTYGFSGYRNTENLDGPFPVVLGQHRMAPVFICSPYTEVVGDELYSVGYAVFGHGPLRISNIRIGETPISHFRDVQYELREGYPDDEPITLVTKQIVEEALSIEMYWDKKDAAGEPQIRRTQRDITGISVDFVAQGGIVRFDDEGNKQVWVIKVRIEYRLVGDATWTLLQDFSIAGARTKTIRRTIYWDVPVRGTYEVQITRITKNFDDAKVVDTIYWTALRSFRPEGPLNYDKPLARIAWRIRMSRQINGMIDTISADVTSICPDWDSATGTWITRPTSRPPSLMRLVLQGPGTAKPEPDARINLPELQDWHDFCVAKGLRYERVHDAEGTRNDVLAAVCAAGRATWKDDGTKYGVVIDRPRTQAVTLLNSRTLRALKWSRSYVDYPDAYKTSFQDRTDNYRDADRVVLRPGFTGIPRLIEDLQQPGVTDPAHIWRAAMRRHLELMHRVDTFKGNQDLEILEVARGDLALLNHDVINAVHTAGRVLRVDGRRIELDEPVTMEAGVDYALRFRTPSFATFMYRVETRAGRHTALTLQPYTGSGGAPPVLAGYAFSFGELGQEVEEVLINRVERADRDFAGTIHMIPHAPQIDTLLDAMVVPTWNGRVGTPSSPVLDPPLAPVFSVSSGLEALDQDDDPGLVTVVSVELYPGPGTTVEIEIYRVHHRLTGAASWSTTEVPASESRAKITSYSPGDVIELQAEAVSRAAVESPWTAIVTHEVQNNAAAVPPVTSFNVETVTGGLRRFTWEVADSTSLSLQGQISVEIRYAAGVVSSWDGLAPLHTGTLSVSPWDSASPTADGQYTFGIRSVNSRGTVSPTPVLIVRNLTTEATPSAPALAAPVVSGSSVTLQVRAPNVPTFAAARFWRAVSGAGFGTAVDISGAVYGSANALLTYTDHPGVGAWDYFATAENSGGSASAPDGPETATVT